MKGTLIIVAFMAVLAWYGLSTIVALLARIPAV
jgi:hypothetical protein